MVIDPDLHEVFLGDWEGGVFRQRIAEGDPIAVRMITEERWDVIPNAEPADVFAARVRRAITRIAAAHPDQRVAAFAHGGTIGQILAQATGSRPFALCGCRQRLHLAPGGLRRPLGAPPLQRHHPPRRRPHRGRRPTYLSRPQRPGRADLQGSRR